MKTLLKDFYFKAELGNDTWYVCAKARSQESAEKRLQVCLKGRNTGRRGNKASLVLVLTACTKTEYKKGFSFDHGSNKQLEDKITK